MGQDPLPLYRSRIQNVRAHWSGNRAVPVCCSMRRGRLPLHRLKIQSVRAHWSGNRAVPVCCSMDRGQLLLHRLKIQSVRAYWSRDRAVPVCCSVGRGPRSLHRLKIRIAGAHSLKNHAVLTPAYLACHYHEKAPTAGLRPDADCLELSAPSLAPMNGFRPAARTDEAQQTLKARKSESTELRQ